MNNNNVSDENNLKLQTHIHDEKQYYELPEKAADADSRQGSGSQEGDEHRHVQEDGGAEP